MAPPDRVNSRRRRNLRGVRMFIGRFPSDRGLGDRRQSKPVLLPGVGRSALRMLYVCRSAKSGECHDNAGE